MTPQDHPPRGGSTIDEISGEPAGGSVVSVAPAETTAEIELAGLHTVSADAYALGEELARGGMGQIVKAVDTRHDRVVAIKRPLRAAGDALRRFIREARMAARLQHPGIVPVYEAGRLPSGEPFFAMKHVEGRNLGEIVRATPAFADRLALLPNLIAVADALAYAHGRGVVHRDLTPSNVLIGAHGETLIIDWGVAKEVGRAGPGEDGSPSPSPRDDRLTATRGVMGTPRFMSPEQASGLPAEPSTDVYSLGAVLYFVLTGQPPNPGSEPTVPATATAAPPPASLPADVPRDLAAIVMHAMARDPADRYADAAEVAADLKRFVTGGLVSAHAYSAGALLRRWARRRRAALAVGATALAAVVAIGVWSYVRITRERDAALAAQTRAETYSAGGEHLVGFLLDNLYSKLRDIGRLDALAGLGTEVERYYTAIGSTAGDVATIDHRATALMSLGDVETDKENIEPARQLYLAALAMVDDRGRRFGEDADGHFKRSQLMMRIGDLDLGAGKLADARTQFNASVHEGQLAAAVKPDEPRMSRNLALTEMRLGDLARRSGDLPAARVEYVKVLAIAQDGYRRWPDNDKMLWTVGWAQFHIAHLDTAIGDMDSARAGYAVAAATRTELVKRDAKNLDYLRDLATNEINAGDLELSDAQPAQAAQHYRAAVQLLETKVKTDPQNASLATYLTEGYEGLCGVSLELDDPKEALQHCHDALALIDARGHDEQSAQDEDALVEGLTGRALGMLGKYAEGSKLMRSACDRLAAAAKAAPAEWRPALLLGVTHIELADLERNAHHPAEAQAEGHAATELFDATLATFPDVNDVTEGAVSAYVALGDVERETHALDRAAVAYRRAIALAGESKATQIRNGLAHAYAGLSVVVGDAADRDQARALAASLTAEHRLLIHTAKIMKELGVLTDR